MFPSTNAGVARIAPSSLFVARTFNFSPAIQHNDHALGGCDVDLVVGGHGRGVVVAQCSQPSAVQQFARLCHPAENDTAVLGKYRGVRCSTKARERRARPLRSDQAIFACADFAFAARANSHDASRVVGVELSGPLRVPFFRRRLQNNVRRGEETANRRQ